MHKSMIVAPQPTAVEAGFNALRAGGNAIDAAITCAFVQFIVSPQMCGVGGYAIATLHLAKENKTIHLDAPALAGSKVTPEMWEGLIIRPNPDGWGYFLKGKVNDIGYSSNCTPGTVKMMATLLERYGTFSWEQVIAPAIQVASEGFMVSSHLGDRWKNTAGFPEATSLLERITENAESTRLYIKADGKPYSEGEILRNPDYAKTLSRLSKLGAEDFYQGELADQMTKDLVANDSFITEADFANYELREAEAVTGTYRGYTIKTAMAPHGGITLVGILNILENYDLASYEHNSAEYIYLVAMAMKAAFADRNAYLGDPEFVDVPEAWLTSKERASQWKDHINADKPIMVSFTTTGLPDTTQVSVVDKEGNCVSLTHSLGSSSGVITPGMGFMYNNSMVNFHPIAGHPNSIAARKGRSTGMAPTIIYKDGEPILTIGAPGATRIITGVLQVILNVLDFKMSVTDAVHAARFDCQGDLIKCQRRIPEYVCEEVRKRHPIMRLPQSHGMMGLVHAVTRSPETGEVAGAADTGAGGMALGLA